MVRTANRLMDEGGWCPCMDDWIEMDVNTGNDTDVVGESNISAHKVLLSGLAS